MHKDSTYYLYPITILRVNLPSLSLLGIVPLYKYLLNGCPSDLDSMKEKYPLSKYLYSGTMPSKDSDGKFTRSMVIGYK